MIYLILEEYMKTMTKEEVEIQIKKEYEGDLAELRTKIYNLENLREKIIEVVSKIQDLLAKQKSDISNDYYIKMQAKLDEVQEIISTLKRIILKEEQE
jgi:hypothetical protein